MELTCCGGIQTFKERAAEIADHAHNPRGALGEAQDFLRGLDEMERQCRCSCYTKSNSGADWPTVFRSAHASSNAMREWMGETKKIR